MANFITGSARTSYKHGYALQGNRHPLYKVWSNMRSRCLNPRSTHYADYGGRGITLDPRWLNPVHFINDMLPTWKPGLELDRKDNDGNYTKENCRWVTRSAQVRNTRITKRVVTPEGQMAVADAAEKYGHVNHNAATRRIQRGMDPLKAVITPKEKGGLKTGTITYIVHPDGTRTAVRTSSHRRHDPEKDPEPPEHTRFRYYRSIRYVAPGEPAPKHFTRCPVCDRAWTPAHGSTDKTPFYSQCPFESFRGPHRSTKRQKEA